MRAALRQARQQPVLTNTVPGNCKIVLLTSVGSKSMDYGAKLPSVQISAQPLISGLTSGP